MRIAALSRALFVPFLLFVLSGFCSLLYQVVWLRLAFAAFGVITPVLSVVISVFMLGLSIGSWLAGRWISRLAASTGLTAIVYYAVAEVLTGIGALVVPALFAAGQHQLLSAGAMDSGRYLMASAAILGFAILPWCICMGTTFPLMIAFLRDSEAGSSTRFSFLYLANVIGAMVGTLISAGILIELIGLRGSLRVGALLNFLIAAAALLWGLERQRRGAPVPSGADPQSSPAASPATAGLCLSVLFSTGFVSMAMEVVWIRAFTRVLTTTVYAFASVLAVYLFATWIGSWLYRRDVRHGAARPIPVLLGWLAVFAFLPVLMDPRLHTHRAVDAVLIWLSLFPFCAALGYLTPQVIDLYSSGREQLVGSAYAVNVVGCILGPLAAGYLLLPVLGVRLALVVLALPFVAYLAWFLLRGAPLPRRTLALPTLLAAALLVLSTGVVRSYDDAAMIGQGVLRRDHTATVICRGQGRRAQLLVNGYRMTVLNSMTKVMAHLPLASLQHPPRSALAICLGMGTTFRSLTTWPIRVTAVELVPSVKASFGYFFADADSLVRPPERQIVVDDGRRYLNRSEEQFDVITIDPPPPVPASGSSLLYSTDFYEVVKRRLTPGGVLQQWFPAGEERTFQAILRSLRHSFPHLRVYGGTRGFGFHLLASMQPIEVPDADAFVAKLPEPARRDLVEWENLTTRAYASDILSRERSVDSLLSRQESALITDDRPYNEYFLLRRAWHRLRGDDRTIR